MTTEERIIDKLNKIKALAQRGVGGERETAIRMYNELKSKYNVEDESLEDKEIKMHWFPYHARSGGYDEKILLQIMYKVIGKVDTYTHLDKRHKREIGCYCTHIEAAEIELLYSIYSPALKKELESTVLAFTYANHIFPDETARCYEEPEETHDEKTLAKHQKAAEMAKFIDPSQIPRALIEVRKESRHDSR